MVNSSKMQRHIELRKLPAASLYNLATILEINKDWQKVVPLIPKDLTADNFERKYNYEHMRLMEKHAEETNRKFAEVLFDEWGTSGRVRPTLETLMMILYKAEIFRAVDEISLMLGEPPLPRPSDGPAAPITTNISALLNDQSGEQTANTTASVDSGNPHNSDHDQAICNHTTRQLKEPSDLIKFSETILSKDIPNLSVLQTFGDRSTALVEQSDLIKFSSSKVMSSAELPDFSALIPKTESDSKTIASVTATTVSTEPDSSRVNSTQQSSYSQYSAGGNMSSVPNIYSVIDNAILTDKNLVQFDYSELEAITNNFSDNFAETPVGPVGKIGSGGFGEVYVGRHRKHGLLAIKRVRMHFQISCEVAMKVFNTEVKALSLLRHENIVPIFGYSIDGITPCIVCEYIDGGSLSYNIQERVLQVNERMNIIKGTAEGLKYIHHSERPPQFDDSVTQSGSVSTRKSYFLHGDVKSANILLTKDCVPKLCDFGLAKQLETTFITTKSMMGTSAYMAPEGFSGTVTQKNDIFSFGIVLLELLTGLKPIVVENGESNNIKSYVEENCEDNDITRLVDKRISNWTKAQDIFIVAQRCLQHYKNQRPTIDEVCNMLDQICAN
ncbi:interleukin-1 receptor-associated kinase 4-like [Spodoptera frugiperda]|uniref:Interleukin-1 receptor-associated kinase 4-like n=1 Tax=Spodoptera frugiperda TaxID=7108 RepID=A0A9R0D2Z3_SPOFR|nr:interleukin-1 receptor-associated kinase 4-like [Spodoptera frugiperda]